MEGCCGGPPSRHSGFACRFTISTSFSHMKARSAPARSRCCKSDWLSGKEAIKFWTDRWSLLSQDDSSIQLP